jgi:hypothetical protein
MDRNTSVTSAADQNNAFKDAVDMVLNAYHEAIAQLS